MNERETLATWFEQNRPHLRAVAYRMLGSLSEADDAVQEGWLRLSRSDTTAIDNLVGWLTTVVARVCLDMLRSRKARREEPERAHVPDPIISRDDAVHPEAQVLLANSIGLALIVILETLDPAERLAFVLHDMFGVPFDEIAGIVDKTPAAARQLASRGRRRVQGAGPVPEPDLARQRIVVDAFLAASRGGNFDALIAVLDPDVVLRGDRGEGSPGTRIARGAVEVAKSAILGAARASGERREIAVLVNGAAGLLVLVDNKPFSVLGFTVIADKIVEINVLADPARLALLDVRAVLGD